MFCNDPSEFIENSGLVIIKSTDYGKRSSREVYNKPLWIQVQKMYDLIDDIVDSVTVKNNLRSSVYYNYPKETLREIGTNAIYHNDYSEENHPVEMIVRDDHVTIVNYNQPLPPVTVDDLNNKNYIEIRSYINKELEKPFLLLSYIEKSGTGLETAKRELRNNNSPDIEFSTVDGVVTYTKAFIKINEKYVLYKEKVDDINQKSVNLDQKSVNSDQKSVNSLLSRDEYNELVSSLRLRKERENNIKGLYEVYAEDNVISNSVLRDVLGISTNVATRLIKNMVEKQLIINADGLGKGKYRFNKDMLKKQ